MTALTYTRYEFRRILRSKRFFIMTLAMPLAIYFMAALPHRNVTDLAGTGISLPLYYMIALAAFGAMAAVLSAGARIAAERAVGWNRQLRLMPLSVRAYFRTKALLAYTLAGVTIAVLYVSGIALGVHLSASQWIHMTDLMLLGLVPLVALGILLGHLLSPDAVAPAVAGTTGVLAYVSGVWFPLSHGTLQTIAQYLPSYWLVQASHVALAGRLWPTKGFVVVAVWSIVLIALAARAYRRDTQRV
jgi:ABC-2 type transport system permease protein